MCLTWEFLKCTWICGTAGVSSFGWCLCHAFFQLIPLLPLFNHLGSSPEMVLHIHFALVKSHLPYGAPFSYPAPAQGLQLERVHLAGLKNALGVQLVCMVRLLSCGPRFSYSCVRPLHLFRQEAQLAVLLGVMYKSCGLCLWGAAEQRLLGQLVLHESEGGGRLPGHSASRTESV